MVCISNTDDYTLYAIITPHIIITTNYCNKLNAPNRVVDFKVCI